MIVQRGISVGLIHVLALRPSVLSAPGKLELILEKNSLYFSSLYRSYSIEIETYASTVSKRGSRFPRVHKVFATTISHVLSRCEEGSAFASLCPEGTFSEATGLTLESLCQPCTEGHYCPTEGEWLGV